MPTPVPAESAGVVPDVAFKKAQVVNGALFEAKRVAGTVQVKFSKLSKGFVGVSATATLLSTGKKVSAKVVKVPLSGDNTLSGTLVFKAPIGDLAFSVDESGEFRLGSDLYSMSAADMTKLPSGKFILDSGFALDVPGELLTDLLPMDVDFSVSGSKWTFAKNASVKWAKPKNGAPPPEMFDKESGKGLVVDTSKGKTNLSALKLTYKAKDGTFKGSFKVYALEGEGAKMKLKKYTVNVAGIVVDGVGYGRATCKKPAAGPWSVVVQ